MADHPGDGYSHRGPPGHPASSANIDFFRIAWTPQLVSTTWVTPKSTATDISEIASSSLRRAPIADIAAIVGRPAALRRALMKSAHKTYAAENG